MGSDCLGISLGNIRLSSPLIAASGCYGYGSEYAEIADPVHLGGVVTKSISPTRWAGNPPPRLVEVGPGLINSIGLANVGVDEFIASQLPELRKQKTVKLVSVAGKVQEDYIEVIRKLEEAEGIDGYEVNISCPNVKEGGMAFSQNPTVTEQLIKEIRALTDRFVTAKLTPNVASIADGAKAAQNGGADAISLINTVVGMAVDWKRKRPRIATITGGYSGPPIKPIALAKVWEAWNTVSIPIIGMGGIIGWQDVLEFMIAGASAVQVGTALYADPSLPEKINSALSEYCEQESLESLSELTGSLKTDFAISVGVPG